MGIILNEYEWVEHQLSEKSLGKKPMETLSRIARFYYENKYNRTEIRELLEKFLLQCDPNISIVHWSDALDKTVKNVNKYPLRNISGVVIYKSEIEKIHELDGKQIQRLAFALLCISKYWDAVSETNNHWVNTKDKEVMQMANINTSIKRQSEMFYDLNQLGMIRFSKKVDNLNVQVLFSEDVGDKEVALIVKDFRNLGYQYMNYYGGQFFECANCGLMVRMKDNRKGRKPKYCQECAVEIRTKQNIDSVMRKRRIVDSYAVGKNDTPEVVAAQRL